MIGPYTSASTPKRALDNLREALSSYAAIASAAHDWDVLDELHNVTWALQVVNDLERMVAERDEELAKFRSRWGTP